MENIYIVVEKTERNISQGDNEGSLLLSTYGGRSNKQFPAFNTKEDAEYFISINTNYWNYIIKELPIYNRSFEEN